MNPPLLLVMRYAKEAFKVTTSQGKTYTVPKVRQGAGRRAGGGGGLGSLCRVEVCVDQRQGVRPQCAHA